MVIKDWHLIFKKFLKSSPPQIIEAEIYSENFTAAESNGMLVRGELAQLKGKVFNIIYLKDLAIKYEDRFHDLSEKNWPAPFASVELGPIPESRAEIEGLVYWPKNEQYANRDYTIYKQKKMYTELMESTIITVSNDNKILYIHGLSKDDKLIRARIACSSEIVAEILKRLAVDKMYKPPQLKNNIEIIHYGILAKGGRRHAYYNWINTEPLF